MDLPVFLSYARGVSAAEARALHRELGEDQAFLDTTNIEAGDQFPERFTEALLGSRVVVVFASERYFQSWYCLRELRTALAPYDALLRRPGTTKADLASALRHVIVALPGGTSNQQLEGLPPALAMANAPQAGDTSGLAGLVRRRLEELTLSLRAELTGPEADAILEGLVEEAAIPPPASLAGVRVYHRQGGLGLSLEQRFVGRANDLWRIHFALCTMRGDPAKSAAASVRLHSGGGYGKTRVALEYVLRYGPRYFPGGLFWIDANTDPAGLEEQFHDILRILDEGAPELSSLRREGRSVAKLLWKALSEVPREKPVLCIVDDIAENRLGEKAKSLSEFCPGMGLAAVLGTSRQSVREPGVIEISLDPLPAAASALLLQDGLDTAQEVARQDWNGLAELVGGLPLALDALNKVLVAGAYTAADLLQRIRQASVTTTLDSASRALQGQFAGAELKGITEALSVSFEILNERSQFVACILAQLAPVAIPEPVMKNLGEAANAPDIRAALSLRNFVTGRGAGIFGVMHRVMADFLKTRWEELQPKFLLAAGRGVGAFMTLERCQDPKEWAVMNICRTHAEHLFGRLSELPDAGEDPELISTVIHAGNVSGALLYFQGDRASARQLQRRVLEASRSRLGSEHADTLREMSNLGMTLSQLGELEEAHRLQSEVVAALWKSPGPDHEDTLDALHNLAWTLHQRGEYGKARELQEHVLRGFLKSRADEDPKTVMAISNLAETLVAQEELAQARVLQEAVLRLMQQIDGEESLNAVTAMCNLGKTLRRLKETEGSLKLLTRAEEIGTRRFGQEHPITLLAGTNRSAALTDMGDWKEARRVQEKVLEVQRRRYGAQHPETLTAMDNLATSLQHLGEISEAQRLQEESLETRTRVYGVHHPFTIFAMRALALTLFAQKERARSCGLFEQCYLLGKRVFGLTHPETIACGSDLATALKLTGKAKAAEGVEREQRVIDAVRRIASAAPADDQSRPQMLNRIVELNELAKQRRGAGDYRGAMESISAAIRLALGGPESQILGVVLTTAGSIYLAEKRFGEACDALEASRFVFHDLGQSEGEWTAFMWMGQCADEAGEFERAIAAYESAYEMASAAENRADMIAILRQLGPLYGRTGRIAQQAACQRELANRSMDRGIPRSDAG
jgi:tetratricopeptide (TPR) repeat protein